MNFLTDVFARQGFLPHGYCFTWSPGLLWTMVGADGLIALAYLSIPLAILRFVRLRGEPGLSGVAWMFSAFILACGTTHVMDVWTIWQPDYAAQAATKAVTAGVSVATALALWPMIPRALRLPSAARLQAVIDSLEAEVRLRRSAEAQLAEIQHHLATTLASIGAGFIAANRDGLVTRMNGVAERLTGWRQEAARGQPLMAVFQREGRPPERANINPVELLLSEGGGVETVHRVAVLARDGRRTPAELQAALTRTDDGQVRGMALVLRDLSQVVRAEADSAQLAAIVESSTDAIIGKTLGGRINSWNSAAAALFGYSAVEAIGQPVQMLMPAENQADEMAILARLAEGERVPPFETERLTKDGRRLPVSITVSPIRNPAGKVIGASKIVRDISGLRLAEQARLTAQRLESENRQIQAANRLKSQFLANMSHELRTPLNAVIGFADLLHSGFVKPENPQHHKFLGHIATSGRHLLRLINDVLDLSKVESGQFEFHPEPLDLGEVLKEVGDVLHSALQNKSITLTHEIDSAVRPLQLDPARFKQVLYNYLSNAIKFSHPGGAVTVRAMAQGPAHFRLEVQDHGIGIAAADLPRLFGEFVQLDSGLSKQHQGTGLGLALTRRLVLAQGGDVGVRSTPGLGSVFHLVLNRVHGTDEPRLDATVHSGAPSHRVLVVEPDGAWQRGVAVALGEAGYLVDLAPDADAALRQARRTGYAALTLSLDAPGERGLALLARIRSGGASASAPVIGLSLAGEARATGFVVADLLSKPIRSDEVATAMAGLQRGLGRTAHVMVVDDDPLALSLMQATLATLGMTTTLVPGGREALAQLHAAPPDAMVLDLMMPGCDGFEVLHALQALPAWRNLPVYIWTSMALSDADYATLAGSARAIVHKGGGRLDVAQAQLRRWQRAAPALGPTP